jgi:hypothetical protein
MADFTDLDWAFTCPDSVTDDDLRGGYEILVARFRTEGAHLMAMSTPYQLLIERTITGYVKAKQLERRAYGVKTGGYEHAGQEKDFNLFVLKMLHEINDMLRKDFSTADQELTIARIKEIMLAAMSTIPDPATRDDLARRFAVAFEQHGL